LPFRTFQEIVIRRSHVGPVRFENGLSDLTASLSPIF
jgi:hypothetical protein